MPFIQKKSSVRAAEPLKGLRWFCDQRGHLSISWTGQASDGRRKSQVLSPRPGTRGLCVCRGSFISTPHSSPLARARALMFQSRVEEDPGVLPGRSSYSRAPVSGRRFQSPPPHAGTSAGPSRPHWQVCYPWVPLALVGQKMSTRTGFWWPRTASEENPRGFRMQEMGPKLGCLALSW